MQPAPGARHFSDVGLSLDSAKSKAKKLIRIANYRLSGALLLRACNSQLSLARARKRNAAAWFPGEFSRFSSEQGCPRDTGPVDAAGPTRYRRRWGFSNPSLPKGESALFKVSVSLAALGAFAAAPALANAAPTAAPKPTAPAAAQQAAPTRTALINGLGASFKAVDTNGDGFISAAEAQAAEAKILEQRVARARANVEAEFTKLETNKDGQLSKAEFMAAAPTAPNVPANGQAIVNQLDTNKDGKISLDEYRAPRLAMFDKLDTNKDGTISATERQAAQAAAAGTRKKK